MSRPALKQRIGQTPATPGFGAFRQPGYRRALRRPFPLNPETLRGASTCDIARRRRYPRPRSLHGGGEGLMQGLVPASLHNSLPQVCRPCSRREAPHPSAKRATIVTAGEGEARGWGQGPHAPQGCAVRAAKAAGALRCRLNNPIACPPGCAGDVPLRTAGGCL